MAEVTKVEKIIVAIGATIVSILLIIAYFLLLTHSHEKYKSKNFEKIILFFMPFNK